VELGPRLSRQPDDGARSSAWAESEWLRLQSKRARDIRHETKTRQASDAAGDFTEEITRRGMVPASRLLEQTVIDADVELAASLEVQIGTPVMRLLRLRLADGIPMAVEKAYLSLSRFSGIERINFAEQSLYQTLREKFGVQVAWTAETIEILPTTREGSRLLEIPTRTRILSISRNTITEDRVPIEITVSRYRADRYRALVYIPATAIHIDATIYKE
jgi:GntR family transcriptional regulator